MESHEYQSGQIMEKLASLETSRTEQMAVMTRSLDDLNYKIDSLTRGVGERVEKHGERLAVLENDVSLLRSVAWLLFAASATVVVATFFKLIMK